MGITHKALLVGSVISFAAVICTTPSYFEGPGVLPVLSGGKDDGETRPGFEIQVSARAYTLLSDNELALTTTGPQGGATESGRTENPLDEKPDMAEGRTLLALIDG